jgi:hypothetical protein
MKDVYIVIGVICLAVVMALTFYYLVHHPYCQRHEAEWKDYCAKKGMEFWYNADGFPICREGGPFSCSEEIPIKGYPFK